MEASKKPKRPLALDEKLRLWEERFQALTELSSEWYWEQDENCRFTLVTGSSTVGHGGIDPKKFLGTFPWDRDAGPGGAGGSWARDTAGLNARAACGDVALNT